MKVTEKLARYIIAFQKISELELGFSPEDKKIRNQLEKAFPFLLEEREEKAFNNWLWSNYIERQFSIIKIRTQMRIIENRIYKDKDKEFDSKAYKDSREKLEELGDKLFAQKDIEEEKALKDTDTIKVLWRKETINNDYCH